jgi:hypothetical protein
MTIEELEGVPFHFVSHMSCADEHTITYQSEDGRIAFCDHVPTGMKRGRTYRHYWIDHKVYKTKKAFLEAIKDFEL